MKKLLALSVMLIGVSGCAVVDTVTSWFGTSAKKAEVTAPMSANTAPSTESTAANSAVASSTAAPALADSSAVLVKIDGQSVGTYDEFIAFANQAVQMHPYLAQFGINTYEKLPNELREQFLDAFVKQKVVEAWGRKTNITDSAEYKEAYARAQREVSRALVLKQFEKGILSGISVNDQDVRAEYEKNRMQYVQAPETTSVVGAKFKTQQEAQAFFDRVKAVQVMTNFDAQASSAGGMVTDLGAFSADPRVPGSKDLTMPMRRALFQSKKEQGKFVMVTDGDAFWVLFKKEETPAQYYPLEQIAQNIHEQLMHKKFSEAFEERIAKIRAEMTVDVDAAPLAKTPQAEPMFDGSIAQQDATVQEIVKTDVLDDLKNQVAGDVVAK